MGGFSVAAFNGFGGVFFTFLFFWLVRTDRWRDGKDEESRVSGAGREAERSQVGVMIALFLGFQLFVA